MTARFSVRLTLILLWPSICGNRVCAEFNKVDGEFNDLRPNKQTCQTPTPAPACLPSPCPAPSTGGGKGGELYVNAGGIWRTG